MLLSEAIRLGAMLRPQTTRHLFDLTGSCAMGAAWEAFGFKDEESAFNHLFSHSDYPWGMGVQSAMDEYGLCPICLRRPGTSLIPHLNDEHRWTREAIADLVEGWEMQLGLRAIPWEVVREEEYVATP